MAPINNIVVTGSLPGRTADETVFPPEEQLTVYAGVPTSTKSLVGPAVGLYSDALQVFLRVSTAFDALCVDASIQTTVSLKPAGWEWETFEATQYSIDGTVVIKNTAHGAYVCMNSDGTLSAETKLTDNCKFQEITLSTKTVALFSPSTTRYMRIGTVTGLEVAGYAKTSALAGYVETPTLADYAKTSALDGYVETSALDGYVETPTLADYAKTSALAGYANKTAANTFTQTLTMSAAAGIARPVGNGSTIELFAALQELLTAYEGSVPLGTTETITECSTTFITPTTRFTKLVNRQISSTNQLLPKGSFHCMVAINNVGFFPNAASGWHSLRGHFIYNQDLAVGTNDSGSDDILIPVSWHCHSNSTVFGTLNYPQILFRHKTLSTAELATNPPTYNAGGIYYIYFPYVTPAPGDPKPEMVLDPQAYQATLDFKLIRIGDYTYDSLV
jgi:hypothetical protein